MITLRFNRNTKKKARAKALKHVENLSGIFRVIRHKQDGAAELNHGAIPEHVAEEMKGIKNIRKVEIFDMN